MGSSQALSVLGQDKLCSGDTSASSLTVERAQRLLQMDACLSGGSVKEQSNHLYQNIKDLGLITFFF